MSVDPDKVYIDEDGNSEEWLRPGDVAQLLKVHPATVSRWAKIGKIPYITTPSGQRRYAASVIAKLVAGDEFAR